MGPASQRGIWLPNLRRPDVSARHMANLLDAKVPFIVHSEHSNIPGPWGSLVSELTIRNKTVGLF